MRFKKIYIEITNICNMNCSFCPPHNRKNEYMNRENFEKILDKIKPYTEYIYLHVKGEPMLHPDFDDFVKLANDKGFFVNITTNGTLLDKHLNATKYIRQLNISLHATNNKEIIDTAKQIKDCYVNFRVWNVGNNDNETITLLENAFDIDINSMLKERLEKVNHNSLEKEINFTLKDNFYISLQNEFKWPDLNEQNIAKNGYCHALKDHVAILVDGTVVPCCLDNNGDINLGNIINDSFENIINSKKVTDMLEGFKNRTCNEELCKKCEYKNKFK